MNNTINSDNDLLMRSTQKNYPQIPLGYCMNEAPNVFIVLLFMRQPCYVDKTLVTYITWLEY